MMELMVEIVVITFAFGGIIGAIIALHLSARLKTTKASSASAPAAIELSNNEEPAELKPVPVDIEPRRSTKGNQRRR